MWLEIVTFFVPLLLSWRLYVAALGYSVFRKHEQLTRAAWAALSCLQVATASAGFAMAGAFLAQGTCRAAAPGFTAYVEVMLLGYVPILVLSGGVVAAMLVASTAKFAEAKPRPAVGVGSAAVHRRMRTFMGNVEGAQAKRRHMHRLVLRLMRLNASLYFVLYEVVLVAVAWNLESLLMAQYWHLLPADCRDYRIMGAAMAGLELLLMAGRVVLRDKVQKEVLYEESLYKVKAHEVEYLDMVVCKKCGANFIGDAGMSTDMQGSAKSKFVLHFFQSHGSELSNSDYTLTTQRHIKNAAATRSREQESFHSP